MDNIADKLGDLKGGAFDSIRIMELMGIGTEDLIDPRRFAKFQEVVEKLSSVPNKEFLLKKLTIKKIGTDTLNLVWEYLKIAEKKALYEEELKRVNDSKEILVKFSEEKGIDPTEIDDYREHLEVISGLEDNIRQINEEINLYEN